MPVRFVVAPHTATPVKAYGLQKPQDCLARTWGQGSKITCGELLQSSLQVPSHWPASQIFDAPAQELTLNKVDPPAHEVQYLASLPQASGALDLSQVSSKSNGFIDAVVQAYNHHHHLILRPDDVWLAILSQFNLYVNANAEALRSHFVAHEGKKELVVEAVGNRYSVDFGALATQMTNEIDKNVIDKDLKDWILPDFTTTTKNDVVTSAVMMMSTLKAYFSYTISLCCGIPSVTLEGEKEDWEKLLARIDRLKVFGKEPEAWSLMLRPILKRFVGAFDGEPDIDFWNHVCHYQRMGSGSDILGGWITAFGVWDKTGKWHGRGPSSVDKILETVDGRPSNPDHALASTHLSTSNRGHHLDGILYPMISVDGIPPGYCEVDVNLDDNGQKFDCMMVSGHMSMRVEGAANDAIRPHPSWFMFIKGPEKKQMWY